MHCPTLIELPPPPEGKSGWPWTVENPNLANSVPGGLTWPRISIVTPSFNQGKFLEETIRSVLLQGYSNLEYIVIDGGSTDESVDLLCKYEHQLAYWVSEPDRGQVHAINKGLQRATGEILAYINSDDYYLPGAFAAIAKEYLRQPFDLVVGTCRHVDTAGSLLTVQSGTPTHLMDFLDLHRYEQVCKGVSQPAVFWIRGVFDTCGIFREDLERVFDFEYWVRAAAAGFSLRHISNEVVCFRRQPRQKSYEPAGGLIEEIRVVQEYMHDPRPCIFSNHDLSQMRTGIRWARANAHYWRAGTQSRTGDPIGALRLWVIGTWVGFPFSLLDLSAVRWLKRVIMLLLHKDQGK